jgi:hypothetical protein
MADEKDVRGMLLKELLDAETLDHTFGEYDVVERAEAFFKKSEKEEQERMADFSKWVEEIARRQHSEPFYEEDLIELEHAAQTDPQPEKAQDDINELAADLDELVSEPEAEAVKAHDKEEKVENEEPTQ